MNYVAAKLNTRNIEYGRISAFLAAVFAVLCFCYIYFIQSSIMNVVIREKADSNVSELNTEIAELESRYIKLRSAITIEVAKSMGFEENFNGINFANVDSGESGGKLSFVGNEI